MKSVKKMSNIFFWNKHIMLAIIIIVIAALVLIMQYRNETTVRLEGGSGIKSVAGNMSIFYTDYLLSSDPLQEELGDFVIGVKTPNKPLGERLQKMESLQKAPLNGWVGEQKHRTFKAGSTLRSAITDYAQSEGIQVIWELDRDFIIKYPFQIDDSLLGSLKMISKAIDTDFDTDVKAYMCPRQRSLVITSKSTEYLEKQCAEAQR
jgi:hypothetical protein